MAASNGLWVPLDTSDARVAAGLTRMRAERQTALARGARHAGWKVAYNAPETRARLGIRSSMVGYLLESGRLPVDQPIPLAGSTRLGAEVELAFVLHADVPPDTDAEAAASAIGTVAPAIEIIDILPDLFTDVPEAMARDIWQRAYLSGSPRVWAPELLGEITVQITHNGASAGPPSTARDAIQDAGALIRFVAGAVTALGERLRAGDLVLSGMIVPAPIWPAAGDRMRVDYGPLGSVELRFA